MPTIKELRKVAQNIGIKGFKKFIKEDLETEIKKRIKNIPHLANIYNTITEAEEKYDTSINKTEMLASIKIEICPLSREEIIEKLIQENIPCFNKHLMTKEELYGHLEFVNSQRLNRRVAQLERGFKSAMDMDMDKIRDCEWRLPPLECENGEVCSKVVNNWNKDESEFFKQTGLHKMKEYDEPSDPYENTLWRVAESEGIENFRELSIKDLSKLVVDKRGEGGYTRTL